MLIIPFMKSIQVYDIYIYIERNKHRLILEHVLSILKLVTSEAKISSDGCNIV